jgi:hypothetical protein
MKSLNGWRKRERNGAGKNLFANNHSGRIGAPFRGGCNDRERIDMSVRKRGKGWMMDVSIDGHRQRRVIPNARLEKQAKKAELKLQDTLFENQFGTRKEVPLLADFIDEHFLPWARTNKRSWYHDEWRSDSLKDFFRGKRLDEITPSLIEKFKSREREKTTRRGTEENRTKQSPASVNRKLELLSRILSMAVDFEMIESNPCRRVRKFQLNNHRERYLSIDEEARLMECLWAEEPICNPLSSSRSTPE